MDARDFGKLSAVLLTGILLSSCAGSRVQDASEEAGSRTLAGAEVDGLLLGKGMGMAAVAEINGYPGPQHVLDLKDELDLTPDQRFATSRLVGLVQGRARALGQRIINAERRLDADMSEGALSSDQVRARLETIAALRAQLRFTHVDAHIEQKKILEPGQIRRYYELRGRNVVLSTPAMPAPPTEPLTLPAIPAVTPEPAVPAAGALPTTPTAPMPAVGTAPSTGMETVTPRPAETEAPAQVPAMTPGMQDALPVAAPVEPAPVLEKEVTAPEPVREPPAYPLTPLEETQPRALLPAPARETATEESPAEENPAEENAPAMTPGMQDALPDAAPIEPAPMPQKMEAVEPEPVREPPAHSSVPVEEMHPRALSPEPADTATEEATVEEAPHAEEQPVMTPGMRDALPDAEPRQAPVYPLTPLEETQPPALLPETTEPAEVEEPQPMSFEDDSSTGDKDTQPLSPGMQDAMEFAEPAVEETGAKVHIAPLEDDYELQELDVVDPQEPATVDLDD